MLVRPLLSKNGIIIRSTVVSMQGDLNKKTRHVRGLDRSRQTESEETPMESYRRMYYNVLRTV